jgi:hypothetical protein
MTRLSASRHTVLQSLLDKGELVTPAVEQLPTFHLPEELRRYRPPSEDRVLYRGDFVSCNGHGHYSRIWTAGERGALDHPLSILTSRYGGIAARLEGFWSLAQRGDTIAACHEIARQIETGTQAFVEWLIDRHTDAVEWSPFVSTTFEPGLAARYAPEESMAVFECRVNPRRCLRDVTNIGGTGTSGEILVLGWIPSDESNFSSSPRLAHNKRINPDFA